MKTESLPVKKLLAVLFLVACCAGCANRVSPTPPPPSPPEKDFTIDVTFNYDFTNFAACSATVTTGCISGFTWGYSQGTSAVALKTSATSVCTGTTQPEACTDSVNSQLPMGSLTFYVVANFINNAGVAGSTAQDTTATPVVITAGAPTGLTVTAQ